MIKHVSHISLIGSLVYRTKNALSKDAEFVRELARHYPFYPSISGRGDNFPFWHYVGTQPEIETALNNAAQMTKDWQYPNLMSIQPVRQTFEGNYRTLKLDLVFSTVVSGEWSTEERERYVFAPLLRPLYNEFMLQLANSCYFISADYHDPYPHEYYENFATGGDEGVILEKYGNHISAIEVHNLELKFKNNLCDDQIKQIECENELVSAKIKHF